MTTIELQNTEFGVGEEHYQKAEAAFPLSTLPVPQFLTDNHTPNRWPPNLIMDLALGLAGTEAILDRFDLTESALEQLYSLPEFRKEVGLMTRELHEDGVTYGKKCALMAESHLDTMDQLLSNVDTPASVRLSIFQAMAKYGKLEPVIEKTDNQNTNQIQVNINF